MIWERINALNRSGGGQLATVTNEGESGNLRLFKFPGHQGKCAVSTKDTFIL